MDRVWMSIFLLFAGFWWVISAAWHAISSFFDLPATVGWLICYSMTIVIGIDRLGRLVESRTKFNVETLQRIYDLRHEEAHQHHVELLERLMSLEKTCSYMMNRAPD